MPRWALASLVAVVLVLAALGSQSYYGRVNIHNNELRGCMRSTLDRHVNAKGWRIAEMARYHSWLNGGPNALNDLRASIAYDGIAASLESRTAATHAGRQAFCDKAFPSPSIAPWKA